MDYSNIILEMLDRIKTLEKEVADLKNKQNTMASLNVSGSVIANEDAPSIDSYVPSGNRRDTTRYLFDGYVYSKNRLVLAVVKSYVAQHKSIDRQQLKLIFGKQLQGSIGVVENVEIAPIGRLDYNVRFFTRPEEIIHLSDGDMYVCTQWGIGNIDNFIKHAKELGFKIEAIK